MLTLKQAAHETGMTKQAIQQAIKKGRVSASRNTKNEWEIDPAELFRVYKPAKKVDGNHSVKVDDTLQMENKELELELKYKNKEIILIKERTEELEKDRDKWQETAQKVTLLLENKTNQNSNDWKSSIKKLEERISNQEKKLIEEKQKLLDKNNSLQDKLEEKEAALNEEKAKGFFKRLFGGKG